MGKSVQYYQFKDSFGKKQNKLNTVFSCIGPQSENTAQLEGGYSPGIVLLSVYLQVGAAQHWAQAWPPQTSMTVALALLSCPTLSREMFTMACPP